METIYPKGQSHLPAVRPAHQLSLLLTVASWAENGCRFLRAMFHKPKVMMDREQASSVHEEIH